MEGSIPPAFITFKTVKMTNDLFKGRGTDMPEKTSPTNGTLSAFFSMIGKGFRFIRSKWSIRYWVKKTNGEKTVEREFTIKKDC